MKNSFMTNLSAGPCGVVVLAWWLGCGGGANAQTVSEFQPDAVVGGSARAGRAVAVTVNPGNSDEAIAASESGGLFQTTTHGLSWSHLDNLPMFRMRDVKYGPLVPGGGRLVIATGPADSHLVNQGGTVDMGAYEFQAPMSKISYAWLQHFNLPINSSTDSADPDGDGVDNYHEWLAGTNPTNPFSSPAQLTITTSVVPPGGIILTWSTNAIGFTLQSTTNLGSLAVWSTNSPAPVVVNGQNTVTNPISGAHQFYRLVQRANK